ncbi:hypothetical protein MTO96_006439 [Rhipicephalus appendiculatus]
MAIHIIVATAFVFLGCCTNVFFLELLVKEHPGCTNLITFSQFLFIAIEGFIFTTKFGKRRPVIPLKHYVTLVVMCFLVSVSNNHALSYDISMPLHMIFKSGSLIANMVPSHHFTEKEVPTLQAPCSVKEAGTVTTEEGGVYTKCVGIGLLLFALLLSARMGIYQETLYARHGKHPRESLFYVNSHSYVTGDLKGKDRC